MLKYQDGGYPSYLTFLPAHCSLVLSSISMLATRRLIAVLPLTLPQKAKSFQVNWKHFIYLSNVLSYSITIAFIKT